MSAALTRADTRGLLAAAKIAAEPAEAAYETEETA